MSTQEVSCVVCGNKFDAVKNGKKTKKCCSAECTNTVKMRNLKLNRQENTESKKTAAVLSAQEIRSLLEEGTLVRKEVEKRFNRMERFDNPPVTPQQLPPVEKLPAAYLKQCAEYWSALTHNDSSIRRIA